MMSGGAGAPGGGARLADRGAHGLGGERLAVVREPPVARSASRISAAPAAMPRLGGALGAADALELGRGLGATAAPRRRAASTVDADAVAAQAVGDRDRQVGRDDRRA